MTPDDERPEWARPKGNPWVGAWAILVVVVMMYAIDRLVVNPPPVPPETPSVSPPAP